MTNTHKELNNIPIFLTPKRLADEMGLPIGGMRHWLFHRETNGLSSAVYQIGRKLLIDKQAFIAWIAKHNCIKNGAG